MKLVNNQSEFDNLINTVGDGFIMVKFYADWCGPCKLMKPIYENLATEPEMTKINEFVEINRDDNMDLITDMNFDFMSIPRFFAVKIKDGKIETKQDLGGSQTKTNLQDQILEFIK